MSGGFLIQRKHRLTGAVFVFLLFASLVVSTAGAERADACTLVPDVAHVTVNQGSDSHSPLAWGKEALVRAYMLLPSCASAKSIDTTGATLTVKVGTVTLATLSPYIPITSSQDITSCCTPSSNSPADPLFLVSQEVMSQGAGDLPLTFTVAVNYKTSSGQTGIVTKEVIKVLGKRANPMRVLFIPMGNKALSNQWTSTDTSNLQKAIGTAARMMPVAEGTDGLAAVTSTAGFKWELGKTLLDLGPGTAAEPGLNVITRSDEKFCGNDTNFDAVKLALVEYLHEYASANPSQPVDRVMGVTSPNASVGSATSSDCFDGQAAAPASVAWTRIAGGSLPSDGSILMQEFAHNFGAVPQADPRYRGWHSASLEGEFAGRGYDLVKRAWISDDRSALRRLSPWHDGVTLLEWQEWQCISGALGGTATPCAPGTSIGSPASGVELFRVTGRTDGTKAGSFFLSNRTSDGVASQEPPEDPDRPDFYLAYRSGSKQDPGPVVNTYRLPATFGDSEHHEGADGYAHTASVDGSFPFDPDATLVEVWNGLPTATSCGQAEGCLYAAEVSDAPTALRIEVAPTDWTFDRNVTESTLNEVEPSLSADGEYLAYVERSGECGALVVERSTGAGPKARLEGCGTALPGQPALSPDAGTVAFVRDGDLWRVEFNKELMAFGTETKIYSCVREAGACVTGGIRPPLTGPASRPSWSPAPVAPKTDQWLVFSVQGDVYRLFPFRGIDVGGTVGVAQPERLTSDGNSSQPTVGPINADGTQFIAFKRETADGPTIFTMEISSSDLTVRKVICCGRLPSWGGELIAYERVADGAATGDLAIVNPDNPFSQIVTGHGTDTWPSLVGAFGRTMAIERTVGSGSATQTDIFLGKTTVRRDITLVGRDSDNPLETRGFIYLRCSGVDVPVARALTPSQPDPTDPSIVAYTTDNHDSRLDCENGPVVGMISDTYTLSNKVIGGTTDPGPQAPVAAILSPSAAASAFAYRNRPIALRGYAWDAEGSVLPPTSLKWALRINGTWVDVPGTGGIKDVRPGDIGIAEPFFPAGQYTARLTATDAEGRTDERTVDFYITGVEAAVDFDPDTLYVPSNGNPVTLHISGVADLAAVKSARITAIDGERLATPLGGTWKYDKGANTAALQVDRATLASLIPADRIGQRVLVTVEGCSTAPWGCGPAGDIFAGADPAAPVTSPSS